MKVSMNGLRKNLIANYNSLVKKLNRGMDEDGFIQISPEDINKELDSIQNGLVVLAFSYNKGDENFQPMDDNTHFETFNEK
jgi:hypothetical protein